MASSLEDSDDEQQQIEAEEEADLPSHEFSSPWDDSDLVLIVENQKLHVHSFMLKMASPVFKAMLSGDFKEKNAQELVLPGKKADQFVDFLRQIYPQFDFPIQLENIEHIYVLAEEYQTKTVIMWCLKTLQHIEVTKKNVLRMIVLAQKMGCDEVRLNCYQILNEMTVDQLTSNEEIMAMDKESLLHQVFIPKAKRLEKCLTEIQPQFAGVLDCLLYVWGHEDNKINMRGKPTRCFKHTNGSQNTVSITQRLKCAACVHALGSMASYYQTNTNTNRNRSHYYNTTCRSNKHFDIDIVKVLQEMVDVLNNEEDDD